MRRVPPSTMVHDEIQSLFTDGVDRGTNIRFARSTMRSGARMGGCEHIARTSGSGTRSGASGDTSLMDLQVDVSPVPDTNEQEKLYTLLRDHGYQPRPADLSELREAEVELWVAIVLIVAERITEVAAKALCRVVADWYEARGRRGVVKVLWGPNHEPLAVVRLPKGKET